VEFIEALGAEALVYVATSAGRIIVRGTPGAIHARPGSPVRVRPEPAAVRLFDAAGQALGAPAPQPAPMPGR
jgi:hypothetical protein